MKGKESYPTSDLYEQSQQPWDMYITFHLIELTLLSICCCVTEPGLWRICCSICWVEASFFSCSCSCC